MPWSRSAAVARLCGSVVLLFGMSMAASARAQSDPLISETVVDRAEGEALDASGPRTVLDLEDAAESVTSLADEVEAAPSTQVRRAGALGAPAYVSIRGADPWQVRVVLDGVPLNGAHNTAFDLSTLPVELLGRVVVHRSNVPVQLGAPLPGGVLELETRAGAPGTHVSVSGGSFGTRRIGVAQQSSGAYGDLLVAGVYSGAHNRFAFFDDGGTPLNDADDRTATRRNAHVDSGGLLVRHRIRAGGWRLTTLGLGTADVQGVPGLGSDQALQTELRRGRAFAALHAHRRHVAGTTAELGLLFGTSLEFQRYRDPGDELGLRAQDDRERSWLLVAGARPSFFPHGDVQVDAVLDWTGEGYRPDDGTERPVLRGLVRRDTLALGLQTTWSPWAGRVELTGAGRADVSSSRSALAGFDERVEVAWSPHAGLGLEPWQGRAWSVRAFVNAGLSDRVPGFFELYGDRGLTVGNPALRPERRVGYDVGVQLSGRADGRAGGRRVGDAQRRVRGALSWGFFDRRVDDLILFVQSSQGVAVAQNIARAAIRGHELTFDGRWSDHLRLGATWSLIDAVDRSGGPEQGAQLPGRPVHTWAANAAATWRWVELDYRADGNGPFSVDRQGRRPMPARVEHDLSLVVRPDWAWRPALRFDVHNVADARTESVALPDGGERVQVDRAIADFVGQPLPGRAFYLTLTLRPGSE